MQLETTTIIKTTKLITNGFVVTGNQQGWYAINNAMNVSMNLETESKLKIHNIPVNTTVHRPSHFEIKILNT